MPDIQQPGTQKKFQPYRPPANNPQQRKFQPTERGRNAPGRTPPIYGGGGNQRLDAIRKAAIRRMQDTKTKQIGQKLRNRKQIPEQNL